jgi:hypothetical protein
MGYKDYEDKNTIIYLRRNGTINATAQRKKRMGERVCR